ncbi:MAG: hypothetical protein ACKPBT_00865, partial [Microcystis aeruginosa]
PESFSTQSTSADRRAMNLRLNNSLQNANLVSQLNQVSGSYTITDHVTPNSSLLFQLRTGTYQRAVQFWFFVTWYGSIGGHKSTKSLSGKTFN